MSSRCACGAYPRYANWLHTAGVYHCVAGCGPHLIWEGATCRGAEGRWEAWCCNLDVQLFNASSAVLRESDARECEASGHVVEFTFTEAA